MPTLKEGQPRTPSLDRQQRKVAPEDGERRPEARLCVNLSDPISIEAMDMLHNAGFKVSATSVSGLFEPELHIGAATYEGMRAIRRLVDHVTKGSPKVGPRLAV